MQAGNARPVALLAGKVHAQYIVEGFAGGGLLLLCALGLVALDAVRSRATGGAAVVRSSAHCRQTMRPRPFRGASQSAHDGPAGPSLTARTPDRPPVLSKSRTLTALAVVMVSALALRTFLAIKLPTYAPLL